MFKLFSKVLTNAPSRQLFSLPKYSISKISDINKVIDVLRIEFDKDGYFINFPGRTMPVPLDMSISEAQLDLLQKYSFGEMHFFNKEGIQYAVSTPLQIIIQDDFFMSLENQLFYIVNTLNSQNLSRGVSALHDIKFDNKKVKDLCQVGGHTMEQQNILQEFIGDFVDQLKKDSKEIVDRQHIDLVIKSVLNRMSIKSHHRISQLEKLISVVEKRLSKEEKDKEVVNETYVQKKMRTFFKRFFALVLAQIAFIQYGTYIFISWDFMEPITCLLGISDAILAYGYWLFINRKYSYETLAERKVEKMTRKKYYTSEVDENEIFAKKDVLDYLYRQKYYHSNSLPELLKLFAEQKELERYYNSKNHTTSNSHTE